MFRAAQPAEGCLAGTDVLDMVDVNAVIHIIATLRRANRLIRRKSPVAADAPVRPPHDSAYTSRLPVVGEPGASIAREINQPLGAIPGNASTCDRFLDADEPPPDEVSVTLTNMCRDASTHFVWATSSVTRARMVRTRRNPGRNSMRKTDAHPVVEPLHGMPPTDMRATLGANPGVAPCSLKPGLPIERLARTEWIHQARILRPSLNEEKSP